MTSRTPSFLPSPRAGLAGALALAVAASASAFTLFVDFGSYSDGNLVGQNGWQQLGTVDSNPLQVQNGRVIFPPGATVSNQDAVLDFPSLINAPTNVGETKTFYFGTRVTITEAGANPSYFAALNIFQGTATTGGNFANARLAARSLTETSFEFGVRVTGQAGYPYVYGGALAFGTEYVLVARVNLVAGPQNDTIDLFVFNPGATLDFSSVYATSSYTSGAGTDPASYGAVVLSQFASATVQQPVGSLSGLVITDNIGDLGMFVAIPEPSTYAALFGAIALGLALWHRRRTRA
jgi:hypothetical protein